MRSFVGILCFLMFSTVLAGDLTVATVDMQRLFKEYPGTAPAQSELEKWIAQRKQDLEADQQVSVELQKELTNPKGHLTAEARKVKEEQFQESSQDFDKERNDVQTELANRQADMTQNLVTQIKAVVAQVAQQEGVDLVLDSADTAAIRNGKDLTEEVLKKFTKPATGENP